jgi:hypothetical protein
MTQTIQPRSWKISIYVTNNDLPIQKPEAEDNKSLMLSVFDNLNNLYEKLNRLNYVIQRRKIKQILYPRKRGEKK